MALMSGLFTALLTVGDSGAGIYGFANFTGNIYGSLTSSTFTDRGGTSRTITAIHWDTAASGSLTLRLAGTGISNADSTFTSLRVGGTVYPRSSALYSSNDAAGNSSWLWSTNTSGFPTSGSVSVAIN